VGAAAGGNEPGVGQGLCVDDPHAVAEHVGDDERPPVRGEPDVLRNGTGSPGQTHPRAGHLIGHRRRRGTGCGDAVQVDDLDQVGDISVDNHQLAPELAAGDQDGQVGGEVGVVDSPARQRQCPDEGHGRRVSDHDGVEPFGHD
jgi:hypothetical protein